MNKRRRSSLRPGPALATLLFVVLAGVIGMHGLDTHGVAPETTPGAPGNTKDRLRVVGHGAAVTHSMAEHGEDSRPDHLTPPPPPEHGQGDNGTATAIAMCMVVLTTALTVFGFYLPVRPRTGLVVRQVRRLPTVPEAVQRDRDPPSLAQLSILRC